MNIDRKRKKSAIALIVATFLAAIEGTIVGTAMPSITKELHGMQAYSWVITIYLLATVITTPIYGKLSDLYGRKKLFIIGALIFLTGSTLSGAAQSMTELIGFRALQGIGAGALTTIPSIIIGDLYPFEQRARMQGWLASVWGISGITGPLLGGILVDFISWRAIFYMNIPIGVIVVWMLITSLHETFESKKAHIDYAGIGTFSIGMISFLYALTLLKDLSAPEAPWTLFISLTAIAALCMSLFVWIELRSPEPFIPFKLFKNYTITMANTVCFLICVANVVVIFYLPLWIQGVMGWSATYSGLAMIPLSIGWPLGSIIAGNMMGKLGSKMICVIAGILLLISSVGYAAMDANTALFLFLLYMLLAGFSFGLTLTVLTVAVTSAVGWELRGTAVASNNFIRTLGQTVGIAVFGILLHTGDAETASRGLLEASLHEIFVWAAVLSVLVLTAAFALPTKRAEEQGRSA